ncbi:Zn-ribbon domain-containing OB-fold protein [Aeromicrobium alkaliterrae]|uniref:ChsH2 C-terminal OB-fold domain-containing protein n=1 Tax=Aeromicrobium alkaliterrae TaxID=302168 RepID=A0ABP4VKM3_9ACTN
MTEVPTQTPLLQGSRCTSCENVAYPVARGCQRCGAEAMTTIDLGRRGTVWGFTVQRFAPKSPPYVPPADGFVPFAVGYVELPEGVKVEAVLDCDDPINLEDHAEVELVASRPVPRFVRVVPQES